LLLKFSGLLFNYYVIPNYYVISGFLSLKGLHAAKQRQFTQAKATLRSELAAEHQQALAALQEELNPPQEEDVRRERDAYKLSMDEKVPFCHVLIPHRPRIKRLFG